MYMGGDGQIQLSKDEARKAMDGRAGQDRSSIEEDSVG